MTDWGLLPNTDGFTLSHDTEQSREYRERLLAAHRRRQHDKLIQIAGFGLVECPGVFSPSLATSTRLFVNALDFVGVAGKKVLDVGTGTGVLAILAARRGAARVVAVDQSQAACACAVMNCRRLNLAETIEVKRSNLFRALDANDRFDVIIANLPFLDGRPRDDLDRAVMDQGLRLHRRFLADSSSYLSENRARILVSFSSLTEQRPYQSMLLRSGFTVEESVSEDTKDGSFRVDILRHTGSSP